MDGIVIGQLAQSPPPRAGLAPVLLEFFSATPWAGAINVLIVILVMWGLWDLTRARRRLQEERSALAELKKDPKQLSKAAEDGNSSEAEDGNSKEAEDGNSKEAEDGNSKEAGEHGKSIAARRVRAIAASAKVGLPTGQDLVAAADSEELYGQVTVARTIATSVVLLGLAGTLIGLSVGLAPLEDVLRESAPRLSEFWDAMSKSVSGMRTAFSTTLSGVVGALIVGAGLARYRKEQGSFLADLERSAASTFTPALAETEATRLGDVAENLRQLGDTFSKKTSSLIQEVESRGSELVEKVTNALDDTASVFHEDSRALIARFEEVRDAIARIIGTPADDTVPLADQVQGLGAATTALERSVASINDLIPALRDTLLESYREQADATREMLDTYYSRLAEQVQKQSASTAQLTDEVRRTAESVSTVAANLSGFAKAAEEFQAAWSTVADSVKQAERTLDSRFASIGQSIGDAMTQIVEGQSSLQQRVVDRLTDFDESLKDTLELLERERRRAVQRSEELIRELREAVKDAIREMDARATGQQDQAAVAIKQGLRELQRELRDMMLPTDRRKGPQGGAPPGAESAIGAPPGPTGTPDLDAARKELERLADQPPSFPVDDE